MDVNGSKSLSLTSAELEKEYRILKIDSKDSELNDFLFTIGCYSGELITVVSMISGNYVVAVKDARYSIDKEMAEAISVEALGTERYSQESVTCSEEAVPANISKMVNLAH